ncbi:MAG: class I SAM-dependent methyltransferase [Parachlamydiales bacterium]|jgi:SAM-dependent methyltransferase
MKILEIPQLLLLNLYISYKNAKEFIKVAYRYYSNNVFRKADLAIVKAYFFKSAFRIHKQFMKDQNATDIYQYGETYLTAFEMLLNTAGVTPQDVYVELGCGRGRTCFWAYAFKKCRTIGLDIVPPFIEIANRIVQKQNLKNIEFVCQDFLVEKWPEGTVYYIDATLSENHEIAQLIRLFDQLPENTKVIAINMTLTGDYPSERSQWKKLASFDTDFPWGISEANIFVKNKKENKDGKIIAK